MYVYNDESPSCTDEYLRPFVLDLLKAHKPPPQEIFEIGCGNGSTAFALSQHGYRITGIDTSKSGVEIALRNCPGNQFFTGSVYDNLSASYGTYPVVISLEVIEHCQYPRQFMKTFKSMIEPNGIGIFSTPYHGFLKNLAILLSGKFDDHFNPLWDDGHLKFFSEKTLGILCRETGFKHFEFHRVGRIKPLAKSIIVFVHQ